MQNWTFAAPGRQLRLMIGGVYVTGNHYMKFPIFNMVDWSGPTRNFAVIWPQVGPMQLTLETDAWALVDGVVGAMPFYPNPLYDANALFVQNTTMPTSMSCLFGWIIPPFNDTAIWDPTVLISLFSPDITPPNSPPKSTFDRNAAIIAGSVVGGVVVATAAIATILYLIKQSRYATHGMPPRPSIK